MLFFNCFLVSFTILLDSLINNSRFTFSFCFFFSFLNLLSNAIFLRFSLSMFKFFINSVSFLSIKFYIISRLNSECLINFELNTIVSKELKLFVLNISFYFIMGFSIRLFYLISIFTIFISFSFFCRIAHCRKSCTYG